MSKDIDASCISERAIESCIRAYESTIKDHSVEFNAMFSMWLLQHAFSQTTSNSPIDINSDAAICFISDAIITAHNGWLHAVSFVHDQYDIELDRFGFLVQMSYYADGNGDPKLNAVYRKALDKAVVIIGDKITNEIQLAQEEATKELKDILDAADETLLQEFFTTFQEIGTFYRDPSRYDNDEDRKRHHKMVEIYNQIMTTGNS